MRSSLLLGLALAAVLAAATFCKTADPAGPSETPKDDPSLAGDIQPVFTASCALSGCHAGGAPAGALTLVSGQSHNALVNVFSSGEPQRIRVIPGDSAGSYLIVKLEGRQAVGSRMPPGGPLSATSLQNIKNWIAKGAQNN